MRRSFVVTALVQLCIIALPHSVFADKCDDMAKKAKTAYHKAQAASERGDYPEAIAMFENSGKYYQKASQMKNCNCPLIEKSARNNVELCKDNIKNIKKVMANNAAVDSYNQGVTKFNEGNLYAQKGEWALAVTSFDAAETIWRGISSASGDTGKQAQQMADEAHKLLQKAKQRL